MKLFKSLLAASLLTLSGCGLSFEISSPIDLPTREEAPPLAPSIPPDQLQLGAEYLNNAPPGARTVGSAISGEDHLGLLSPHYHASDVAEHFRQGEVLGVLDTTFGTDPENLRTFLKTGKVGAVRMHLLNTVCVRNSNCGSYEPLKGYSVKSLEAAMLRKEPKIINFIKTRTTFWRVFFQTYFPNTPVYMSPFLEHNLSPAAWRNGADAIWSSWSLWLTDNPLGGSGQNYKGITLIEDHLDGGINSKANVISTDGQEIMDIDSVKYAKDTENKKFRFRWSRRQNCRHQGNFQDPRQRKDCMSGREAEQQVHVYDPTPGTPARQFKCTNKPFDRNDIWKPLAEDKGSPDARKNLPVIIPSDMPHSSPTLVTAKGDKVGSLTYYGKYTDGRPRSYSGTGSKKTGYEFQKEALRLSGSPWVWAKAGGRCVGPFVPGRRQGTTRSSLTGLGESAADPKEVQ